MRQILSILILLVPLAAVAEEPHLTQALAGQLKLVDKQPHDPRVHNDLGNLLQLAGELEEAEVAYRQALQLSPDYLSARYNLGLLLQQAGRTRAAIDELRQVVKENPGHARAHYQLGIALAERGRRSQAVEHYARSFVLDPELRNPRVNPHIIENNHATQAIVLAHRQRFSDADAAPRSYSDPGRIAELLLPGEDEGKPIAEAESEAKPSEAAAEPKRERRKRPPRKAPKPADMPADEGSADEEGSSQEEEEDEDEPPPA